MFDERTQDTPWSERVYLPVTSPWRIRASIAARGPAVRCLARGGRYHPIPSHPQPRPLTRITATPSHLLHLAHPHTHSLCPIMRRTEDCHTSISPATPPQTPRLNHGNDKEQRTYAASPSHPTRVETPPPRPTPRWNHAHGPRSPPPVS